MREARAVISGGTTGLSSWTAGQSLAAWLDSRPHLLSGKTVLELGAGAGITGIFALKVRAEGELGQDCSDVGLEMERRDKDLHPH